MKKAETQIATKQRKLEWQRKSRAEFVKKHGFSLSANYSNGGLREKVLQRDNYSCVKCKMTDTEHKIKWNRPITVDHKDKNRKNNTLYNLQTLCLKCHGNKDISPFLKIQRVPAYKIKILTHRWYGKTYQEIADELNFSIAAIWKWVKKWEREEGAWI